MDSSPLERLGLLAEQFDNAVVELNQPARISIELDEASGDPTWTLHAKSAYTLRKSAGLGDD